MENGLSHLNGLSSNETAVVKRFLQIAQEKTRPYKEERGPILSALEKTKSPVEVRTALRALAQTYPGGAEKGVLEFLANITDIPVLECHLRSANLPADVKKSIKVAIDNCSMKSQLGNKILKADISKEVTSEFDTKAGIYHRGFYDVSLPEFANKGTGSKNGIFRTRDGRFIVKGMFNCRKERPEDKYNEGRRVSQDKVISAKIEEGNLPGLVHAPAEDLYNNGYVSIAQNIARLPSEGGSAMNYAKGIPRKQHKEAILSLVALAEEVSINDIHVPPRPGIKSRSERYDNLPVGPNGELYLIDTDQFEIIESIELRSNLSYPEMSKYQDLKQKLNNLYSYIQTAKSHGGGAAEFSRQEEKKFTNKISQLLVPILDLEISMGDIKKSKETLGRIEGLKNGTELSVQKKAIQDLEKGNRVVKTRAYNNSLQQIVRFAPEYHTDIAISLNSKKGLKYKIDFKALEVARDEALEEKKSSASAPAVVPVTEGAAAASAAVEGVKISLHTEMLGIEGLSPELRGGIEAIDKAEIARGQPHVYRQWLGSSYFKFNTPEAVCRFIIRYGKDNNNPKLKELAQRELKKIGKQELAREVDVSLKSINFKSAKPNNKLNFFTLIKRTIGSVGKGDVFERDQKAQELLYTIKLRLQAEAVGDRDGKKVNIPEIARLRKIAGDSKKLILCLKQIEIFRKDYASHVFSKSNAAGEEAKGASASASLTK